MFEILSNSRNLCTINSVCFGTSRRGWASREAPPPGGKGADGGAGRGRRLLALLETAPSGERLGARHALTF